MHPGEWRVEIQRYVEFYAAARKAHEAKSCDFKAKATNMALWVCLFVC